MTPELARFGVTAVPLEYSAGSTLFRQGHPSHDVYWIESGLAKLVSIAENGNEVIIGLRSSGRFLGAASVIVEEPYPVSALTLTPCKVHRVAADQFREVMTRDAQFSWYVHKVHCREIYDHVGTVVSLACSSATARLRSLLMRFLPPNDKGSEPALRLRIPLKDREIAQLLAISPEYLSRMLRRIHQRGLIRRERGCLVITNIQHFSEIASLRMKERNLPAVSTVFPTASAEGDSVFRSGVGHEGRTLCRSEAA